MSRPEKPPAVRQPLVLVPGFMASNLWSVPRLPLVPPFLAWPLNLYSLTAQLFSLRSNNTLRPDGLVEGYYDNLIAFCVLAVERGGLGYKLGEDFWIFAYDWRLSCRTTGRQLTLFVQEKLNQANEARAAHNLPLWEKADIISHSMGGIVTQAALSLYHAPLDKIAYVAVPHRGTPKAYFCLHPATVAHLVDEFVIDFIPNWYWNVLKAVPNVFLLEEWLIRLLSSFPSVYELLPDAVYLRDNYVILDKNHAEPRPVYGVENTYFSNLWAMPPYRHARIRQAIEFKEQIASALSKSLALNVYTDNQPTYAYAEYGTRFDVPHRLPDGDATVPAVSARLRSSRRNVTTTLSHAALLDAPELHKALRKYLMTPAKAPKVLSPAS